MNIIKLLEKSNCLVSSDLEYIKDNLPSIQATWEKKQVFRTRTEMELSVLNDFKHPTNASKYWQAVREQAVFYEQLVILSFEYKRNDINIKKLKLSIDKEKHELEKELLLVDLEEAEFTKASTEQVAKHRIREIKSWDEIMAKLDDGSFDTADVNTHQLDSYTKAFANKAQTVNTNTPPADASNIIGLHLQAQKAHKEGLSFGEQILLNKGI